MFDLSVIIPVYNGEKYLADALESIISQPIKDIEIIVVDDGSKDKSLVIAKKYAEQNNRIKVIHKENGGVGTARNKGIEESSGKWLMFLDQDDTIVKNAFDFSLQELLKKNNVDVYSFGLYFCNSNKTRYLEIKESQANLNGQGHLMPLWKHHSSFIIKKDLIDRYKIRYTNLRFDGDEQFRFFILYYSNSTICIDKPIFCYKRNPNSETHKKTNVSEKMMPIIKAWHEIKLHKNIEILCNAKDFEKFCDVMINFQFLNCLMYYAISGTKPKEVVNELQKHSEYKEFCDAYVYSNSSEKKKKEISLWLNHSSIFYLKYHFIGLVLKLRSVLSKISFIEKTFDDIKFKSKFDTEV